MSPTLRCSVCSRTLFGGKFDEVKICSCGNLFCAFCALTKRCKCCFVEKRLQYPFLSKLCTFFNIAPEHQLRLIDLQVKTGSCSGCGTADVEQYRCKIQEVLCHSCNVDKYYWWSSSEYAAWLTTSEYEVKFMQIIGHTMHDVQLQGKGKPGMLPMQITNMFCYSCEYPIICQPFIINGALYCYACGGEAEAYFSQQSCSCLMNFIACIECIPENQLHLLTYSEWVKAVRCDLHQNIINELDAVSSDGKRKGRLRSFFKDGEVADESWSISVEDKQFDCTSVADSTMASTFTTESHISTLLTTKLIACQCGRKEAMSNVFVCTTCSVYGVCALCTIRKHSGHEYQDALKMATISFVNDQSELALQKLRMWSVQANELNVKSEKAFKKLCSALGATFEDAMINSEDHHRIHTLLERTNTSTVEKFFKETVNSTMRLHKAIDYFCEELTEAVEKDKGNNDASVQETSVAIRNSKKKRRSKRNL